MMVLILLRAYLITKDEGGRIVTKGYQLIVKDGLSIYVIYSVSILYLSDSTGIAYFLVIFRTFHSIRQVFLLSENIQSFLLPVS